MADKWAGYPNTNGVPDDGSASWVSYEQQTDRIFGFKWTATENGTISHVNLNIAEWNPGANGGFIVVYNNGTKVAQSVLSSPTENEWTGELSIAVVSGESLVFSTSDVLVFGLAFDGDGSLYTGLQRDENQSYYNEYAAVTVGATGPPAEVSFSTSGTYQGNGIILRYAVALNLEQEGFRFRADDDSESSATWLALQDVDITRAKETNTRLRILLNTTGDQAAKQFKLQYKKTSDSVWRDMPES